MSLQLSIQEKKPKAKAACKKPAGDDHEPAKDDNEPAKPETTGHTGRKRKLKDLPAQHAEYDEKKKARMEASQAKADEMCKVIRASGIMDLQPPVGFTSKYHDCNSIDVDYHVEHCKSCIHIVLNCKVLPDRPTGLRLPSKRSGQSHHRLLVQHDDLYQ